MVPVLTTAQQPEQSAVSTLGLETLMVVAFGVVGGLLYAKLFYAMGRWRGRQESQNDYNRGFNDALEFMTTPTEEINNGTETTDAPVHRL